MRQRILAKRGAFRELSRAIRRRECVGLIVDQNAGRHGIFVDYFGRPASTTPAAAMLALRYRLPVVMAWLRREKDFPYRFFAEAPLPLPDTGDRDEDIRRLTETMTQRIEEWVREAPGQWLWAHRRWKAKPPVNEEVCRPSPSTSIA
jgi:KDO2-lipid IV(A) lauroyltransferase